jgi:biotin carboxylase
MRIVKKIFVIVDAYTTGRFLAPYLNAHGYACIHVQSTNPVIPVYIASFVPENFIANYIYRQDMSVLLNYLKQYEVLAVMPGAETGVLLADQLNTALSLKTANNIITSIARRDKYEMVKQLTAKAVLHAHTLQSNNLEEIMSWAQQQASFPFVVKPVSGSGSQGVKICNNQEEIMNAVKAILTKCNVFNEINHTVLIQEYLKGQEYIVNTVSYGGKHKVVDIWRKYKILQEGTPINDYSELIGPEDIIYQSLVTYINQVLTALDIRYGAGHSEVIVTEQGPILVETAARLAGSIDPSALMEALGFNHVSSLINSYLKPEDFMSVPDCPRPKKYARHVFFSSPLEGQVKQDPDLIPIVQLRSFHSLTFRFSKGSELLVTKNLADFPGFCYLVSESKTRLASDYQALREIETRLYANMVY